DESTELAEVFAMPTPGGNGHHPVLDVQAEAPREMRFVDAIADALRIAMRRDARVLIMGQDIAEYGGVFKVTEGFLQEFGRDRVRNTPIIESGAIGAALGLAIGGYKPVVEMQYADFIAVGFSQIVNNLASTHYRWGQPVNVTIRAPYGGYIGAGPFHSQAMEAWFAHVPGLKVVVPSTPSDARALLLEAIEDPNPVLFFEHKHLYRSRKGLVPDGDHLPIGRARVVVQGDAVTIVTWGIGVVWAEEEAAHWASKGVAIEVVDLRTIVPWDRETVLDSVRKTNRVLVLHEAPRTSGFGAEIAASVAEACFSSLDAPPARVGGLETPIPFGSRIEKEVYAARARLRQAVVDLLAY
ncbi:MAG TPA: alpha-ketoacid dehydrogenase subunit beta, partial [Rhodothermales bacterium]